MCHRRLEPMTPAPELSLMLPRKAASRCSPSPWRSIDRKSTRLNSSHLGISYAVFCLKKKKKQEPREHNEAAQQDEASGEDEDHRPDSANRLGQPLDGSSTAELRTRVRSRASNDSGNC